MCFIHIYIYKYSCIYKNVCLPAKGCLSMPTRQQHAATPTDLECWQGCIHGMTLEWWWERSMRRLVPSEFHSTPSPPTKHCQPASYLTRSNSPYQNQAHHYNRPPTRLKSWHNPLPTYLWKQWSGLDSSHGLIIKIFVIVWCRALPGLRSFGELVGWPQCADGNSRADRSD